MSMNRSIVSILQDLRNDLNIDCYIKISKLGFEIHERGSFGIVYKNPRIIEVSRQLPHIKQFLNDLYIVEAAIQSRVEA